MTAFADRVRRRQDRIAAWEVLLGAVLYAGGTFGLLYLAALLQHLAEGR